MDLNKYDQNQSNFLSKALGPDLVPINFEIKSRKNLLAEQTNKKRMMDNNTQIIHQSHGMHGQDQRDISENHLNIEFQQ